MLGRLRRRLRVLLYKSTVDNELDEELRYHLEREVEQNLKDGMSPEEAQFAALRAFGGVEQAKERCREARGVKFIEDLWQDLRYGARTLLKQPAFTFVAVLTLALGIGANTAIFSIVNAVLLRPLAYADPERLVQIWEDRRPKNDPHHPVASANFLDWRAQNTVFERIAAMDPVLGFNLTGPEGPERIKAARVSADLFPLFGVVPILGRSFLPEDEQPGGNHTAIVSHGLWQRRYGSDPRIIGQTLSLNGQSFTVVGVTPIDFRFPHGEFDLAIPLAFEGWERTERETHPLRVYARLKAGVTLRQAQEEMSTIARRLTEQYPQTNTGKGITLVPLHEQMTADIRPALLVLLGAVGFVLLIACTNVANLLLARSLARKKEFSVRLALGAGRGRLIRQLLTEGLLLASMGGIAGLLLALWGRRILVSLLIGADLIPRWMEIKLDDRVLLFTLMSALLTGLVFGLAPALTATKADLNETLREGGRKSTAGKRDRRFRHALVISEIALAMMLLVGAGLMIQSFRRLMQVDPGFRSEHILALEFTLPTSRYPKNYQVSDFYDRLLERIGALPGVRSAGGTAYLPLSGTRNWFRSFDIEWRPPLPPEIAETEWRPVTAGYFRTMGIPLTRGRDFTQQDRIDSPGAVIINERMAQLYWPGEDPTGRRLKLREPRKDEWHTVVGVVGDVRHFGLANEPKSEMYFLYSQIANPWYPMTMVIRTESDPVQLASSVRRAVLNLDPDLPIYNIRTMEELVAQSVAPTRLHLMMFGVFGAVALILAASGLYGVMSYSVTQRMNEIGIRMALGAQKRNVLQLVIVQGMRVTMVGVALGLIGAYIVTRLMSSLLFGVGATDPLTFAVVSAVLSATALAACYLPARRATKVDPLIALRYE
jgi:predicted permease